MVILVMPYPTLTRSSSPAHHLLETYIDAYVTAAGIGADKTSESPAADGRQRSRRLIQVRPPLEVADIFAFMDQPGVRRMLAT